MLSNIEEAKSVLFTILENKELFKKNMKKQIKHHEISKYSASDAAKFYVDAIDKLMIK